MQEKGGKQQYEERKERGRLGGKRRGEGREIEEEEGGGGESPACI